MGKFKVGDRVRVKNVEAGIISCNCWFVPEMRQYIGKVFTIKHNYADDSYSFEGVQYHWAEDWLEHDEERESIGCPTSDEIYNKLKEYEDAEEQGRLIKLPCKVGDKVYFIREPQWKPIIEETQIEKVVVRKTGMFIKMTCNKIYETSVKAIGKNIFFSREKAEAALEKMKGE